MYVQQESEDIPPRLYGTEAEIIQFTGSSPVDQMRLFRKWRKSKDEADPAKSTTPLASPPPKTHVPKLDAEAGVHSNAGEGEVNMQVNESQFQSGCNEVEVMEVEEVKSGSEEGGVAEDGRSGEKESVGSSDSSDYGSEAEDIFLTDGLDDDVFAEKPVQEEKHEEHVKSNFEVLSKLPFFAQFTPEHREQLFSQLIVEKFQDGDLIVKQGTKGDRMYVIIDGEVSIWKQLDNGLTEDITYIYAPDFFGELALLYGDERVANVSAVGNTTVMYLTKESFDQFEEIRMFLYVSKVPFLKKLNKESQLQVVRLLSPVTFGKDQDVVVQGEIGDAFYMITKGSAQVIENEEPTVKLYDGHTFGQMALLSDSPRLATVRAIEHLTCLKLTAANFKKLLKDSGNADFSKLLTQDDKQIRRRRSKREQQKLSASKLKGQGRSRPLSQSIDGNFGSRHSISSSIVEEKSKVTKQTKHGKKVINGYVILEKIGSGTFGVVRKCRNEKSKTTYAIKIIDKKRFSGDELKSKYLPTLDDMRKEVAIMKKLSHPNVVNLVAVFDDPKSDALYILTEFCAKGAIMEDLVETQPLPEATARKYFRDVLQGLEYLHYQQIVHRDIKPMNLLLTENDVVKIADFGAARMLMGDQKWVAGVAGTPAFMAPELLSENKDVYDGEPVDLWSCGATLYMFVTGSPPWMSDDELQLAKKVKNDELVFPKEDDIKLSPHVKNLIRGLLVKDPDKRMTLLETMKHDWVTDEFSDPLEIFYADREICASDQQLLPNLTAEEKTEAIIKVETSSSFMSSRGSSMRSALYRSSPSNPSVTGKQRQRASTFDIELGEDTVYVEHLNIDSDDDMSVRSECSSTYGGLGEEDIGRIESFHRDKDDMLRVRVRKLPSTQEGENEQNAEEEAGDEAPPSPVGKAGTVSAKHGKRVSWCGLRYGLESHIGERSILEDTTCIVHKLFAKHSKGGTKHAFYASLFDGHGGDMVSQFLADNVHKVLVEQSSFADDLRTALKATALEIDRKFLKRAAGKVMEYNAKVSAGEVKQKLLRTKADSKAKSELEQYRSAGSTGLVALITKNRLGQSKKSLNLHLAWVGDSRAVLSRRGIAVQLTKDHCASRLDEKKRIRAAGGTVDRNGRLNGVLAVSRAFGDMTHKADDVSVLATMDIQAGTEDDFLARGALTPLPDIHCMSLDQSTDEFIVMGSDGIFDVLTNQSVVDLIRKELQEHHDVQKAVKALVHHAVGTAGSIDNTTAIIIAL